MSTEKLTNPRVVAVIPDPRAARSLRFSFARTVAGYHLIIRLLSLHNPVARAARALTGRCASKRAARRAKGYTGLANHPLNPSKVQSEPQYLPSDVVLGRLVIERIGLENGIVLLFSS